MPKAALPLPSSPTKALPLFVFEDIRPWELKLPVEGAHGPWHPRGPDHLRSAQGLQRNWIQLQRLSRGTAATSSLRRTLRGGPKPQAHKGLGGHLLGPGSGPP